MSDLGFTDASFDFLAGLFRRIMRKPGSMIISQPLRRGWKRRSRRFCCASGRGRFRFDRLGTRDEVKAGMAASDGCCIWRMLQGGCAVWVGQDYAAVPRAGSIENLPEISAGQVTAAK